MNCSEMLRTQAFLDGELDDTAAKQAERHIENCKACRAFSASIADLSDMLRKQIPHHRAPDALRRRVGKLLDEAEEAADPTPFRRRNFWMGALSGSGGTALAAGLALFLILPPSAATLAQSVTDAHVRALMNGKTIQVVSSNHHTVKPWFAGRVALSPPVADFQQQGFVLAGGRIDKVAGTQAAVVVYRHGKHEIDLFVWPAGKGALPGENTTQGYHAMFWRGGDLNFAAVSDTDWTELRKFSGLVRAEPE
ncbi:MAG: anti-sigma factor [Proteobacteria bacterium]|nr:anti-sigma factor [Pseudomonadota bacterium]